MSIKLFDEKYKLELYKIMKAAFNRKYGQPKKVIEYGEFPKPSPNKSQILIRVHSSSVNRTDCGFILAKPWIVRFFSGLLRPKWPILGCEFAGEVVELGEGVSRFSVGDRVFGFDDEGFGGHGEYMVIDETKMITKIPDNVSYETAGVATEGSHYSLVDIKQAGIKKGDRVFVNGGTGAIGSAAIQILVAMGVEVWATAGTKNLKLVESLGATKVIDYMKEDFTELDEKFDVVFDSVGKSGYHKSKKILKDGGIFMSSELGPRFSNIYLTLWTKLFGRVGKHRVIFPIPKSSIEDIEYIAKLLKSGEFKPLIDRKYKLPQTTEAYEYVLKGEKIGNVVIDHNI